MLVELLFLIIVANGMPVLVSYLFHHRPSLAIDFGLMLADKRRCFGANKTWRGLFSSIIVTALVTKLLGLDFITGLQVSSLAMAGDLFSSFIKRRLAQKPGAGFLFLDQVPESLLPAWFLMSKFNLEPVHIIVLVSVFVIIERVLSLLLFRIGVRKNNK